MFFSRRYYSTLRGCNMTYFATWNNQNHEVLQKFLKNTIDSNPQRLNIQMGISEPILVIKIGVIFSKNHYS